MNTRLLLASALVASGSLVGPNLAIAETPTLTPAQVKAGFTPENIGHGIHTPSAYKAEKCYGIAAAGLNDCAAKGVHSCAGTAKLDRDPSSWIYVPAGYCERIVGGKLGPA